MKKIFAILFLSSALFGDVYFTFAGYSKHFEDKWKLTLTNRETGERKVSYHKYNETHNPIGISFDINKDYYFSVTSYKNSYSWNSTSIIFSKKYKLDKGFIASLNAGIVNGYEYEGKQENFDPIVYPSIYKNFGIFNIELSGTHQFVFIQFRVRVFNY